MRAPSSPEWRDELELSTSPSQVRDAAQNLPKLTVHYRMTPRQTTPNSLDTSILGCDQEPRCYPARGHRWRDKKRSATERQAAKTMKTITTLMLLSISANVFAQDKVIKLYEGSAPGSESWKYHEQENNRNMWQTRVVYNVADPTLTVMVPEPARANGTALVICPGGGFHALSIDSEGLDVARWLATRGVSCFVLKYRLVECKTDDPPAEMMSKGGQKFEEDVKPIIKLALADAQAAVGYVRRHAKEYSINPDRIGILGFSAGGTIAASVAYNYTSETKPNFVAPIYLQYEWAVKGSPPGDAPPIFILAATDDPLGLAPHSVALYTDWTKAKKPAELHLLSKGGHGFGMKKQNLPSDRWIELFADWLEGQGLMKR